jgi:hypothetical protein
MEDLFPPKVRKVIYVLVVMGTAIVVPLHAGDVVSDLVLSLWTSVAGAASALAAFNVTKGKK